MWGVSPPPPIGTDSLGVNERELNRNSNNDFGDHITDGRSDYSKERIRGLQCLQLASPIKEFL